MSKHTSRQIKPQERADAGLRTREEQNEAYWDKRKNNPYSVPAEIKAVSPEERRRIGKNLSAASTEDIKQIQVRKGTNVLETLHDLAFGERGLGKHWNRDKILKTVKAFVKQAQSRPMTEEECTEFVEYLQKEVDDAPIHPDDQLRILRDLGYKIMPNSGVVQAEIATQAREHVVTERPSQEDVAALAKALMKEIKNDSQ